MKMDIKKDVSTNLLSMKDLSFEMYILCLWERWLRHFVSLLNFMVCDMFGFLRISFIIACAYTALSHVYMSFIIPVILLAFPYSVRYFKISVVSHYIGSMRLVT